MASVYIIQRRHEIIKVGFSIKPSDRRSELQAATPERLELIWEGDFGDRAREIETTTKKLLRPWRISGEWFGTNPLIAGLAIEAARDQNRRIDSFLCRLADLRGLSVQDEMATEDEIERDFPDLYPRIAPLEAGTWTDWTGKKHRLPHKKFTRVIVSGFPETTYGCPSKPNHVVAGERVVAEIRARQEKRRLRLNRTLA